MRFGSLLCAIQEAALQADTHAEHAAFVTHVRGYLNARRAVQRDGDYELIDVIFMFWLPRRYVARTAREKL
jgi:hypothetical protein